MRPRSPSPHHVAEVARRRLELLSVELARVRSEDDGAGRLNGRPELAEVRGEDHGAAVPDRPEEAVAQPEPTAPTGLLATFGRGSSEPVDDDTTSSVEQDRPQPAVPGRHALRSARPAQRLAGWCEDRLPPTLQGRVQLGSSHLTVVALLVAVALAVTAWTALRADGAGTAVPPAPTASPLGASSALVAVADTAGAGTSPVGAPSPTASARVLVVDVEGKVRKPGIVTLPVGSRVVDAIEAAGGVRRPGVDLTGLNLARLLADGEQLLVGVRPAGGVAAPAAGAPGVGPTGAMVNINTADQTQLESLPGVGPVTAQAILQWRAENGSFTSVDELLEVSGIGDATLAKIAPFVTL